LLCNPAYETVLQFNIILDGGQFIIMQLNVGNKEGNRDRPWQFRVMLGTIEEQVGNK